MYFVKFLFWSGPFFNKHAENKSVLLKLRVLLTMQESTELPYKLSRLVYIFKELIFCISVWNSQFYEFTSSYSLNFC